MKIYFKEENKKFLKLFSIYQILELLFCFIFDFCCHLYLSKDHLDIQNAFSSSMEWTVGIVIQYVIVLSFWLSGNKFYRKIKITTYCCLDFMPKLAPCLLFHIIAPDYMNSYDQFVIVFSLVILLSKQIFFNFIANKYEFL